MKKERKSKLVKICSVGKTTRNKEDIEGGALNDWERKRTRNRGRGRAALEGYSMDQMRMGLCIDLPLFVQYCQPFALHDKMHYVFKQALLVFFTR